MHVIIFVQSLYAMKNLGKILTLLFDTFHSSKYFYVHNPHALSFLCRLFYLSKRYENFMVVYLE